MRASFPHSFFISFFSCVFRKREERGRIDLRRTRADHVCLTKSSECFRYVVSRYHEIYKRSKVGGKKKKGEKGGEEKKIKG